METRTAVAGAMTVHPVHGQERAWIVRDQGQAHATRVGWVRSISHEEAEFQGRCSCGSGEWCKHLAASLAAHRDDLPNGTEEWSAVAGEAVSKAQFDAIRAQHGRGSLSTTILCVPDVD